MGSIAQRDPMLPRTQPKPLKPCCLLAQCVQFIIFISSSSSDCLRHGTRPWHKPLQLLALWSLCQAPGGHKVCSLRQPLDCALGAVYVSRGHTALTVPEDCALEMVQPDAVVGLLEGSTGCRQFLCLLFCVRPLLLQPGARLDLLHAWAPTAACVPQISSHEPKTLLSCVHGLCANVNMQGDARMHARI